MPGSGSACPHKAGGCCRAGLGDHAGRNDFERPALADVGELAELTGLIEQARSIARQRHPRDLLVPIAADEALHVQSPRRRLSASIAQRRERDRGFDRVAVGVDGSLRVDHEVHGEIGLGPALGVDAIGLNAVRIEEDVVRAPPIVKRIEIHADDVVVGNRVAAGECGAHVAGGIVGAEREIERAAVVADQDLGRLRRLEVVAGLDLAELAEPRRPAPHLLVKVSVDDRRLVESSRVKGARAWVGLCQGWRRTQARQNRKEYAFEPPLHVCNMPTGGGR